MAFLLPVMRSRESGLCRTGQTVLQLPQKSEPPRGGRQPQGLKSIIQTDFISARGFSVSIRFCAVKKKINKFRVLPYSFSRKLHHNAFNNLSWMLANPPFAWRV